MPPPAKLFRGRLCDITYTEGIQTKRTKRISAIFVMVILCLAMMSMDVWADDEYSSLEPVVNLPADAVVEAAETVTESEEAYISSNEAFSADVSSAAYPQEVSAAEAVETEPEESFAANGENASVEFSTMDELLAGLAAGAIHLSYVGEEPFVFDRDFAVDQDVKLDFGSSEVSVSDNTTIVIRGTLRFNGLLYVNDGCSVQVEGRLENLGEIYLLRTDGAYALTVVDGGVLQNDAELKAWWGQGVEVLAGGRLENNGTVQIYQRPYGVTGEVLVSGTLVNSGVVYMNGYGMSTATGRLTFGDGGVYQGGGELRISELYQDPAKAIVGLDLNRFAASIDREAQCQVYTLLPESDDTDEDGGDADSRVFSVTLEVTSNGRASVSAESAAAGTDIAVAVDPDEGCELKSITYTPDGGDAVDITEAGRFTMPAADVTVSVTFAKTASDDGSEEKENPGGEENAPGGNGGQNNSDKKDNSTDNKNNDKTDKTDKNDSSKNKSPKTGDGSSIVLWGAMLTTGAVGLGVVLAEKHKEKSDA